MNCPLCKQEVPEGSNFCPHCGFALSSDHSVPEESNTVIRETPRKKLSASTIVLLLVLVLVGAYVGTYLSARNEALERHFSQAKFLLMVPSLTELHDPQLIRYIDAGLMYSQGQYRDAKTSFLALGDYLNSPDLMNEAAYNEAYLQLKNGELVGYKTIEALAEKNVPLAIQGLESAKKTAYNYAVSLYRDGKTVQASRFFSALDGYKRSDDYLTLIKQPSCSAVKKLIGFENADDILLDRFANEFLEGKWKSSDGYYSFSLTQTEDGYQANYSLPSLDLSHSYYDIEDGIYYLYKKDTPSIKLISGDYERKNVFRFTIVDADTIKIYCYKDGKTYKLFRQ